MNANFPDLVVNGLLICLYSQLILLGIITILNRSTRSIVLGTMCCLLSLSFIYTIYWPSLNSNLVFNLLLGGFKHMFLPSLIYLYLALLLKNKDHRRTLWMNLLPPAIVHTVYLITKFGFDDFYNTHTSALVGIVNSFIFFSYGYYFLKGLPLLKKLKPILLTRIHRRYKVFFFVLSFYGVLLVAESLLPFMMGRENFLLTFSFLSNDFYITLAVLINLGTLFFLIVESPKLKPMLFGNNIYTGFDSISNEDDIQNFISAYFDEKKAFISADFNIKECLKKAKISEREFKLFLKKEYHQTIIEFINSYRINEFKCIVTLDENSKYSLIGVANKVGFNSKATFYRNFKAAEGITPKQYWDGLKKIKLSQ